MISSRRVASDHVKSHRSIAMPTGQQRSKVLHDLLIGGVLQVDEIRDRSLPALSRISGPLEIPSGQVTKCCQNQSEDENLGRCYLFAEELNGLVTSGIQNPVPVKVLEVLTVVDSGGLPRSPARLGNYSTRVLDKRPKHLGQF